MTSESFWNFANFPWNEKSLSLSGDEVTKGFFKRKRVVPQNPYLRLFIIRPNIFLLNYHILRSTWILFIWLSQGFWLSCILPVLWKVLFFFSRKRLNDLPRIFGWEKTGDTQTEYSKFWWRIQNGGKIEESEIDLFSCRPSSKKYSKAGKN